MAKQIYIDENGNEQLVSGTINNAELLPISSSDPMNTKDYIDTGLIKKVNFLDIGTASMLSILADTSIPAGIYIANTMRSPDNPMGAYVSTTLINKATDNGAFSTIMVFIQGHIRVSSVGGTLPSELTFTLLV